MLNKPEQMWPSVERVLKELFGSPKMEGEAEVCLAGLADDSSLPGTEECLGLRVRAPRGFLLYVKKEKGHKD